MARHLKPSPLAGEYVLIKNRVHKLSGLKIMIDDWFDRLYGTTWRLSDTPATREYAARIAKQYGQEAARISMSDEVLVCTISGLPVLLLDHEVDIYNIKSVKNYEHRNQDATTTEAGS